ncbi:phenylacetate--CoA ligase family protein [Caenimonas soli]|uniref:phenylacetate--CoA ligase family protein n=1 Tax=Caenimonas soli TaxID=2735555 RepID=UPI0015581E4C|nr:phenylacetate--CoA ligase family protein [Caenimonas soli]NPC56955.1 phenylacetate--CoA ligase family protein [Caenimonas soli]
MHYATYFEAVDIAQLIRDFPVGEAFTARYAGMSQDALRAHQNALFARQLRRAWQLPFYQRLWGAAGIAQGDIGSVDDIAKLPSFGKQEIMESIARHPPLGDHHGREIPIDGAIYPMILHATSGTTGRPQPLLFSPRTREVQKLMLARAYTMQGMRPTDVVHSVYGHGPVNGGHYIREAVIHHSGATFFSAGTGVETPSVKQVELMRDFGATVIVGFADYIKRLADVAREQGLVPGKDIPVRMISGHLAKDARDELSRAWGGVELYDWYGVGDTGLIAAEGPDHDGMHIMEDAHWVEICDVDSGALVPHGETGDMVVTCLFTEDIFPMIRFNTHDVTRCLTTPSKMNLPFRRIEGFLGRSDNMVKLRGINVYPQALSSILAGMPGFSGEYLCTLTRDAKGREDLLVSIECSGARNDASTASYAALLKHKLGVEVHVELVEPRTLSPLTGIETRQKPIRLLDKR